MIGNSYNENVIDVFDEQVQIWNGHLSHYPPRLQCDGRSDSFVNRLHLSLSLLLHRYEATNSAVLVTLTAMNSGKQTLNLLLP